MNSYETCYEIELDRVPSRIGIVVGELVQISTYQVHAITSTGDQACIADRVQCAEFGEWEGLVHKMNRHEVNSPESAVDPSNKLVDC
jgi:hypothetical protein